MIFSEDIFVPILCPIQFIEPRETFFYRKQKYLGKIISDIYFQIFISNNLFNAGDITLRVNNARTRKTIRTITGTKVVLLTDEFFYVEFNVEKGLNTEYVYFELVIEEVVIADSISYEINPLYDKNLKILSYSHFENDYNSVFTTDGSTFKIFKIAVECGFIPNDFKSITTREDNEQQDMMNNVIDARPSVIEPITFGAGLGIPNWLAHKINCIFLLSDLHIEEEVIVRAAGAELELSERTHNGLGIYKLDIQSYEKNYLPYRIWNHILPNTFN